MTMRKFLIIAAAMSAALTSCNKAELEQKQRTIDSLQAVNNMKDENMSLIATTMADVQANLNAIKEKEGMIAVNLKEGGKSYSEQVNSDVNAIYDLLVENKKKVASLQAKLRAANSKNAEYEGVIKVLQSQIDQQNAEIERLSKMLDEKNVEIGFLNNAVIRLSTSVDSLAVAKQATDRNLQAATDNLNTGYYIIAEKSVLKENNILSPNGLFSKKVLSADVNTSLFTRVNITEVDEIPLSCKRPKVLTNHPEDSYSIETDADGIATLVIKDKASFWKVSKFLVVQSR